ncbi:hypothetical protein MOQ_009773 [Trypanosoma cruzi marinkellei]|uniref:Kinesin motor domain-containing protein n=1 Tax=Trypanosoma cruzi marinkellei TaxID=85056 RepID=K2NBW0_TRYCR|nr:hypothetical protein MOQ_009773 [Trypanosoma cruzi marinkellei]
MDHATCHVEEYTGSSLLAQDCQSSGEKKGLLPHVAVRCRPLTAEECCAFTLRVRDPDPTLTASCSDTLLVAYPVAIHVLPASSSNDNSSSGDVEQMEGAAITLARYMPNGTLCMQEFPHVFDAIFLPDSVECFTRLRHEWEQLESTNASGHQWTKGCYDRLIDMSTVSGNDGAFATRLIKNAVHSITGGALLWANGTESDKEEEEEEEEAEAATLQREVEQLAFLNSLCACQAVRADKRPFVRASVRPPSRSSVPMEQVEVVNQPIVPLLAGGHHVTVIAFGPPQSGKSYTLFGIPQSKDTAVGTQPPSFLSIHTHGLITRVVWKLLEIIQERLKRREKRVVTDAERESMKDKNDDDGVRVAFVAFQDDPPTAGTPSGQAPSVFMYDLWNPVSFAALRRTVRLCGSAANAKANGDESFSGKGEGCNDPHHFSGATHATEECCTFSSLLVEGAVWLDVQAEDAMVLYQQRGLEHLTLLREKLHVLGVHAPLHVALLVRTRFEKYEEEEERNIVRNYIMTGNKDASMAYHAEGVFIELQWTPPIADGSAFRSILQVPEVVTSLSDLDAPNTLSLLLQNVRWGHAKLFLIPTIRASLTHATDTMNTLKTAVACKLLCRHSERLFVPCMIDPVEMMQRAANGIEKELKTIPATKKGAGIRGSITTAEAKRRRLDVLTLSIQQLTATLAERHAFERQLVFSWQHADRASREALVRTWAKPKKKFWHLFTLSDVRRELCDDRHADGVAAGLRRHPVYFLLLLPPSSSASRVKGHRLATLAAKQEAALESLRGSGTSNALLPLFFDLKESDLGDGTPFRLSFCMRFASGTIPSLMPFEGGLQLPLPTDIIRGSEGTIHTAVVEVRIEYVGGRFLLAASVWQGHRLVTDVMPLVYVNGLPVSWRSAEETRPLASTSITTSFWVPLSVGARVAVGPYVFILSVRDDTMTFPASSLPFSWKVAAETEKFSRALMLLWESRRRLEMFMWHQQKLRVIFDVPQLRWGKNTTNSSLSGNTDRLQRRRWTTVECDLLAEYQGALQRCGMGWRHLVWGQTKEEVEEKGTKKELARSATVLFLPHWMPVTSIRNIANTRLMSSLPRQLNLLLECVSRHAAVNKTGPAGIVTSTHSLSHDHTEDYHAEEEEDGELLMTTLYSRSWEEIEAVEAFTQFSSSPMNPSVDPVYMHMTRPSELEFSGGVGNESSGRHRRPVKSKPSVEAIRRELDAIERYLDEQLNPKPPVRTEARSKKPRKQREEKQRKTGVSTHSAVAPFIYPDNIETVQRLWEGYGCYSRLLQPSDSMTSLLAALLGWPDSIRDTQSHQEKKNKPLEPSGFSNALSSLLWDASSLPYVLSQLEDPTEKRVLRRIFASHTDAANARMPVEEVQLCYKRQLVLELLNFLLELERSRLWKQDGPTVPSHKYEHKNLLNGNGPPFCMTTDKKTITTVNTEATDAASNTSSAQGHWDVTIAVPFQTIHTLCGFDHVHRLKRVNGGVFFGKNTAVFVPTTIAIHGHFLYYYDAEGKEPHPDDKAKGGCYLLGATIVGISKFVLEERRELSTDPVSNGSVAETSNKALLDTKRSSTASHVGTNEVLMAAKAVGKQNSHGIFWKFMTNMRAAIGKMNDNTKAVTGEGVRGKARNFFPSSRRAGAADDTNNNHNHNHITATGGDDDDDDDDDNDDTNSSGELLYFIEIIPSLQRGPEKNYLFDTRENHLLLGFNKKGIWERWKTWFNIASMPVLSARLKRHFGSDHIREAAIAVYSDLQRSIIHEEKRGVFSPHVDRPYVIGGPIPLTLLELKHVLRVTADMALYHTYMKVTGVSLSLSSSAEVKIAIQEDLLSFSAVDSKDAIRGRYEKEESPFEAVQGFSKHFIRQCHLLEVAEHDLGMRRAVRFLFENNNRISQLPLQSSPSCFSFPSPPSGGGGGGGGGAAGSDPHHAFPHDLVLGALAMPSVVLPLSNVPFATQLRTSFVTQVRWRREDASAASMQRRGGRKRESSFPLRDSRENHLPSWPSRTMGKSANVANDGVQLFQEEIPISYRSPFRHAKLLDVTRIHAERYNSHVWIIDHFNSTIECTTSAPAEEPPHLRRCGYIRSIVYKSYELLHVARSDFLIDGIGLEDNVTDEALNKDRCEDVSSRPLYGITILFYRNDRIVYNEYFEDLRERERFLECISAMRPTIRIFAPALTAVVMPKDELDDPRLTVSFPLHPDATRRSLYIAEVSLSAVLPTAPLPLVSKFWSAVLQQLREEDTMTTGTRTRRQQKRRRLHRNPREKSWNIKIDATLSNSGEYSAKRVQGLAPFTSMEVGNEEEKEWTATKNPRYYDDPIESILANELPNGGKKGEDTYTVKLEGVCGLQLSGEATVPLNIWTGTIHLDGLPMNNPATLRKWLEMLAPQWSMLHTSGREEISVNQPKEEDEDDDIKEYDENGNANNMFGAVSGFQKENGARRHEWNGRHGRDVPSSPSARVDVKDGMEEAKKKLNSKVPYDIIALTAQEVSFHSTPDNFVVFVQEWFEEQGYVVIATVCLGTAVVLFVFARKHVACLCGPVRTKRIPLTFAALRGEYGAVLAALEVGQSPVCFIAVYLPTMASHTKISPLALATHCALIQEVLTHIPGGVHGGVLQSAHVGNTSDSHKDTKPRRNGTEKKESFWELLTLRRQTSTVDGLEFYDQVFLMGHWGTSLHLSPPRSGKQPAAVASSAAIRDGGMSGGGPSSIFEELFERLRSVVVEEKEGRHDKWKRNAHSSCGLLSVIQELIRDHDVLTAVRENSLLLSRRCGVSEAMPLFLPSSKVEPGTMRYTLQMLPNATVGSGRQMNVHEENEKRGYVDGVFLAYPSRILYKNQPDKGLLHWRVTPRAYGSVPPLFPDFPRIVRLRDTHENMAPRYPQQVFKTPRKEEREMLEQVEDLLLSGHLPVSAAFSVHVLRPSIGGTLWGSQVAAQPGPTQSWYLRLRRLAVRIPEGRETTATPSLGETRRLAIVVQFVPFLSQPLVIIARERPPVDGVTAYLIYSQTKSCLSPERKKKSLLPVSDCSIGNYTVEPPLPLTSSQSSFNLPNSKANVGLPCRELGTAAAAAAVAEIELLPHHAVVIAHAKMLLSVFEYGSELNEVKAEARLVGSATLPLVEIIHATVEQSTNLYFNTTQRMKSEDTLAQNVELTPWELPLHRCGQRVGTLCLSCSPLMCTADATAGEDLL